MSEIKTIEQAADEYSELAFFQLQEIQKRTGVSFSSDEAIQLIINDTYIHIAKHQKELSDAREKLLLDVISEQQESLRFAASVEPDGYNAKLFIGWKKLHETLSSVAKKLEVLK